MYRAARADHWRFWPSVREAWWGVRYVWETGGRPHMFNPNFMERAHR